MFRSVFFVSFILLYGITFSPLRAVASATHHHHHDMHEHDDDPYDDKTLRPIAKGMDETSLQLQDLIALRDELFIKKQRESALFLQSRATVVSLLITLYRLHQRPPEMLLLEDIRPATASLTYMVLTQMMVLLYNNLRDLAISLQTTQKLSISLTQNTAVANSLMKQLQKLDAQITAAQTTGTISPAALASLRTQHDSLQRAIRSIYSQSLEKTHRIITLSRHEHIVSAQFLEKRGQFLWPASGTILYGYRRAPSDSRYHDGIALTTAPAAPVIAPFDGQVVYVDTFSQYGYVFIIRHAPDYYSVLTGAESTLVKLTEKVSQGQLIARMPATNAPVLLYSIKKGTIPEDPMLWLKPR